MFVLYEILVLGFTMAAVVSVFKMVSYQAVAFNTSAAQSVFVEVDYNTDDTYIVSWAKSKARGCVQTHPERFRIYSFIDNNDKDRLITKSNERYNAAMLKIKEYSIMSIIFGLALAIIAIAPPLP